MPILGGTANPLLGRSLLNLLDKQRGGTSPETPPDVDLDVERARQTLDPFGFQAPTADPVYDWGRLASAILGGKGTVLAREGGGRETLAHIRRAIGPYLERLVKSPHLYTVEQKTPTEMARLGSGGTGATITSESLLEADRDPSFIAWLLSNLPREAQAPPRYVTRVVVTPSGSAQAAPHEASHALGLQRLWSRLGEGQTAVSPLQIANMGGRHVDILGDSRTHQMIRESLQRWPSLGDYYSTYRHYTGSPLTGFGELLNEAWAQRQATRLGYPRVPTPETPWYATKHRQKLPEIRRLYAPEAETLRLTGRLPSSLHEGIATQPPLMERLTELHRQMQQPNASNELLGQALLKFLSGK